jgi:D-threo-aldose 1-dehydrogenase
MEAESKRQDSTLPTAAMRFVLGHPAVASVLVGSAKATSLIRNAALLRDDKAIGWAAFNALAVA